VRSAAPTASTARTLVGIPPIATPAARVLVLGSMPGARSLALQQYYANPGNRFWRVAGALLGFRHDAPYPERTGALESAGVALWDVLGSCLRRGSLDAAIVKGSELPNDFAWFLRAHPSIEVIGLNGSAAASSFRRLVLPQVSVWCRLVDLPSTSGANAAWTLDRLSGRWSEVLAPSRKQPGP
jgi:double-stranded uracil-DNA glycosylase